VTDTQPAHTEGGPASPQAATVAFCAVGKTYPGASEPAIRELSFDVPAGEICVLVGPSGCGKTTALRLINRMVEMTSGDILLDGRSVRDRPPAELRPALKNQAQANPARGVSVRRLDHVNYLGVEVEPNRDYLRDTLGALVTEQIVLDDGSTAGSWTTFTNKGYDVVYTRDRTGTAGRLHHIAFATDTREDILRAADIALEQGVFIETGPHKHAIQQTFFLYVYEPGGNRVELCNAGARLVLAPDWQPVDWTETERAKGQAWGLQTIASFHTHGTPPVET